MNKSKVMFFVTLFLVVALGVLVAVFRSIQPPDGFVKVDVPDLGTGHVFQWRTNNEEFQDRWGLPGEIIRDFPKTSPCVGLVEGISKWQGGAVIYVPVDAQIDVNPTKMEKHGCLAWQYRNGKACPMTTTNGVPHCDCVSRR